MQAQWINARWVLDAEDTAELLGITCKTLCTDRSCRDLAGIRFFRWHRVPLYDFEDVLAVAASRSRGRKPRRPTVSKRPRPLRP